MSYDSLDEMVRKDNEWTEAELAELAGMIDRSETKMTQVRMHYERKFLNLIIKIEINAYNVQTLQG